MMEVEILKASDRDLTSILAALEWYAVDHPRSKVEVYRYSSVSIRARIVDLDFAGIGRGARHEAIWGLLEALPEEVQSQLSVLLLLTPEEAERSVGSFDFDHPIPPES